MEEYVVVLGAWSWSCKRLFLLRVLSLAAVASATMVDAWLPLKLLRRFASRDASAVLL